MIFYNKHIFFSTYLILQNPLYPKPISKFQIDFQFKFLIQPQFICILNSKINSALNSLIIWKIPHPYRPFISRVDAKTNLGINPIEADRADIYRPVNLHSQKHQNYLKELSLKVHLQTEIDFQNKVPRAEEFLFMF